MGRAAQTFGVFGLQLCVWSKRLVRVGLGNSCHPTVTCVAGKKRMRVCPFCPCGTVQRVLLKKHSLLGTLSQVRDLFQPWLMQNAASNCLTPAQDTEFALGRRTGRGACIDRVGQYPGVYGLFGRDILTWGGTHSWSNVLYRNRIFGTLLT